jgi:phosphoribosylanthranilate isomerase
MHRTRVKICGITRVEDALLACELGADAIGLVMTPVSRHCVTLEQAGAIRAAVPAFVSVAAVVMDQSDADVRSIVQQVHPDVLQFHGRETPDFCAAFNVPYVKAFGIPRDLPLPIGDYADACGVLLDGRSTDHGISRSGVFDWNLVPGAIPKPLILAGGLNGMNVEDAIRRVHPYAVDISSGVEEPAGRKSRALMEHVFAAVARADAVTRQAHFGEEP